MTRPYLLLPFIAAACFSTGSAEAGCQIEISMNNNSSASSGTTYRGRKIARVYGRAKSKGGTWRKMHKGGWGTRNGISVSAGNTANTVYNATFGCGRKRRYEFTYQCRKPASKLGPWRTKYIPSESDWTTAQQISFTLRCRQFDTAN